MKNIFNKFAFFIALSFVFISCGNLATSENDDSIPQGKGKITISTDLQNGRSVLPTAIEQDTRGLKWELVGTKDGTQQIIESWTDGTDETGTVTVTAYKSMTSNSGIVIDTGTWDFTLTASNTDGQNVLSATISTTINAGENKLNFVMQEATENAASGSIEFTLNFPKDVVDNVEATLYKYDNANNVVDTNRQLTIDNSSNNNFDSVKYSYPDTTGTTSSPLSAGYYILKIELQQKKVDTTTQTVEHKTINTYSCLIRVAPGLTSKGVYTLDELAQLYTVTYNLNEGTFDSTTSPVPTSYNAYTSFELPEPTREGYEFAGWYTDETYNTPAGNDGKYKINSDTTLYAKWVEAVSGITHANNTLYISSYEGLKVFRDIVNGSLESNITIPGDVANSGASVTCYAGTPVTNYNAELQSNITINEDWTPIGVYTNASSQVPYVGEFKGNNNTITFDENFSINSQAAGLFGAISTNCNISNLIIEGNIQSSSTSTSYVGGIVGYATGGSILNCVNRAKFQGTCAGGIAGKTQSTHLYGCVNFGEINGTNYTAGIVGSAASNTSINLCVNIGNLTSSATACGISGDVPADITVQNCINLGTLSATNYIYGISSGSGTISSNISAGKFEGTVLYSCYAVSSSASNKNYYDNSICTDDNFNTDSAVGMATSDFSSWSPDNLVWSAEEGRYPLPNIVATDSPGGISESVWSEICELAKVDTSSSGSSGTATGITYAGYESTYTTGAPKFYITTADGLATFRNMVNGTIEGTVTIPKDADYNSASDYTVNSETASAAIYGELMDNIELPSDENWIPIGSSDRPFSGSFNGNHYTISNLNINAITDNQGLFGVIQGTSSSESCTITSLVVEGNITSSACNVAGIAGKATFTKFESCVNKATVESTSVAAGIAGYVSNVNMDCCYNAGSITASMDVAGIAGYETASDTWKEYTYCINSGTITGSTNYSSIIGIANSRLGLGPCANYGKIISTTNNETGCIIGNCITSGSDITQVYGILSVGPIETQGTYHVIANNVSITSSYYDMDVLSSTTVSGLDGYSTSNFIDNPSSMNLDTYRYTPGVYPIPDIPEYKISEEIWQEIVAAATPQNSGSSGIETNANVSQFSELKAQIESVSDTAYTLENPYVIGITSSFDIGTDITATTNVKSHIKLVATNPDGCTITKNDSLAAANIFTVEAGASLTLGDSNADGELIIDGNETLTTTTKSLINVSGTLVLNEKSTLQNNKCKEGFATNGAAVYSDGGTVKILGGTVKNNSNSYKNNTGGAIYIKNGTFEMTAGVVSNNSSYSSGGAIYVEYSTVTISGGTFENNKASIASGNSVYGGALFLSACTVNITGGTFSNNIATNTGTTTTNTEFYGGAIYIINSGTSNAPAVILNCTFSSNSADQRGGAIYTGGTSYINIANSTFKNNTVTNGDAQGTAVYIGNSDGNININDCEFSDTASDTIFTVYNYSTGGTHMVNGSELSQKSGYNPN